MALYNPKLIRSSKTNEEFWCAWDIEGFMDYVHIYVYKETKRFGFVWRTIVYKCDTREYQRVWEYNDEKYQHRHYVKAVEEYKEKLAADAKRAATAAPPSGMDFLAFMGVGVMIMFLLGGMYSCSVRSDEADKMRPREVRTDIERFILVDYTTPKHYYVTLKSTVDGRVYNRHYVSKHCNNHRDNTRGEEYNVQTAIMFDPKTGQEFTVLRNLYHTFCGG